MDIESITDWVSGIDQKKLNRANLDSIPIMVPPEELIDQFDEFVNQSDKSKFILTPPITRCFKKICKSPTSFYI